MNSCPPRRLVGGKRVGPEHCAIVSDEIVANIKGQPFRRLELRISGTVAGWATKEGPRSSYFNDAPDLVFTQSGNTAQRFAGVGRYEAATGHGISLFIPQNAADWNGKLLVTAHGAGPYGAVGALMARDPDADFNPLTNANRYVGLMLDRGYAVAHTLRSSHLTGGNVTVTLDDGTVLPHNNVSSHGGFIADFTAVAENMVGRQLGRASQRRYFYGFSAGAMMGRLVQYQPGANVGVDGRRLFDAFLLDDAGSGMWLPVLKADGKDTLLVGGDAGQFVHQIDLSHQLYLGDDGGFLQRKRENAKILQDKGLGDRHRMYEIRGVSHFDAGRTSAPGARAADARPRRAHRIPARPPRSLGRERGGAAAHQVRSCGHRGRPRRREPECRHRAAGNRVPVGRPLRVSAGAWGRTPRLPGDRLCGVRRRQHRAAGRPRATGRHEIATGCATPARRSPKPGRGSGC